MWEVDVFGVIRRFLVGVSILGILYFLLPFLFGRILNLGNVTGILVLLLLMLYGFFMPRIAIVTNEYHEYRAFMIAEVLGLEHSAVPAKTPWWLFPTYYIREVYGIIYEWVL